MRNQATPDLRPPELPVPLDQTGRILFGNTHVRPPSRFFARVEPTPVAMPRIIRVNRELPALLDLDPGASNADALAGNRVPPGPEPIAMAYAGHQFGGFSPALGDGRAILLTNSSARTASAATSSRPLKNTRADAG